MSIELTDDQARTLFAGEMPPRIVNPRTRETFVLLQENVYERMRKALDAEEIDPSFYEFDEEVVRLAGALLH